jgi:hypothetical protein
MQKHEASAEAPVPGANFWPLEFVLGCLQGLLVAIPSLLIAGQLIWTLKAPLEVFGGYWVNMVSLLFVSEFLLGHSGLFFTVLGSTIAKGDNNRRVLAILFLFYLVVAGAFFFAAGREGAIFLGSFLLISASRIVTAIKIKRWRGMAIVRGVLPIGVFLLCMPALFYNWPRFGITDEVMASLPKPAWKGDMVDMPWKGLAMFAIYFSILALIDIVWGGFEPVMKRLISGQENRRIADNDAALEAWANEAKRQEAAERQ